MLALTPDATQMIEQILERSDIPDGAGIRIATTETSSDGNSAGAATHLEMFIAPEPEVADQVIENAGARVFVDDRLADLLDDKQLDAAVDGEQVQFRLDDQA
ncbi:MAG TPA: iron-sulfur cluster biosynthesis family protein [Solirubrobacteraceae bacterium]|nr:iron-sulfur cluster biosynthesis family protein [Solirubrobacteraceae bacterium]